MIMFKLLRVSETFSQ